MAAASTGPQSGPGHGSTAWHPATVRLGVVHGAHGRSGTMAKWPASMMTATVAVRLPLSHQRLADLVGAHRPSVTTAMGQLARAGALSRHKDGWWVLHGTAPPELRGGQGVLASLS